MQTRKFESFRDKKVWKKGMLHLKKKDRVLAGIINKLGALNVNWGPHDPYEAIVHSFVYQQIAGSAADAILKRFEGLYGGRMPTPKEFLKTPESKIRGAGISPQKYSYIKDLCERLVRRDLDLKSLSNLPNEEVIARLDEVKGIGRWTAEMFLMFNLDRVDVFPVDDLGIQNAVKKAYRFNHLPSKKKLDRLSAKWEPYRTIAAIYLWRNQD